MPYAINTDLPSALRNHLLGHARDIFRSAFEYAYEAHKGDPRHEKIAFRTAWAAARREYVKLGDTWVARPMKDWQRFAISRCP